ncbi:MAG: glycosyltransferase [Actinomycetota bacterium]|nr:glycosyltransferase [Actinomycetota bacterium]
MSRHIIFVTTEFDPLIPGGAGAVVTGLRESLRDRGHRVTIVLVTDQEVGSSDGVIVVPPRPDTDDEPTVLSASRSASTAVLSLARQQRIDLIEFQDFDGLAFWTLTHRNDTPLESTPIVVRYHLPADHILDAIGVERPEFSVTRAMERASLRSADAVIAQTPSMAGVIGKRYGTEAGRIITGPPPVLSVGRVTGARSRSPRLVVIGRLSEQKGTHDAVRALGPLLEQHPDLILEFVGSDGWSATADLPMREWVRSLVPDGVQDQIVFTDPIPREDLPAHMSGAWAVLVPSRLESFCLAAHEARAMGLPLIARDLPPITDYFDTDTGALIYDGSDEDLRRTISAVLDQPEILDSLASSPLPTYGDPAAVYVDPMPVPRHPHSQAGHATAAIHTLDAVLAGPELESSESSTIQRALEVLPPSVARAAVRVVPRRLKDRFRGVASWPAEEERRQRVDRQSAVDERIRDGGFPQLNDPQVSVVVPCYNHGAYLAGCLLTVFEQTHDSWEVIIVDDGSTDPETVRILSDLDMPRVRVVHQDNTGLPGARNTGIGEARGEFIVPLDADDELLPDYLSTMVDALEDDPDAAFAHCWAELFGDVNWVWATRPYNPYTVLLSNSVLQVATFRISAWEAVGGYDETMTHGNEDWDMWLRFQEAGWGNVQIREPLYRYRKHGISMSVDTEADFERGRERIKKRHPRLYESATIRESKAAHFPLLSVIVAPSHTDAGDAFGSADTQIVNDTDDRCGAIAESNGKYVVLWNGGSTGDVWDLVDRLERDPNLGGATVGSETVYRRWELVDPGTGLELEVAREPDRCPEDGWIVPTEMNVAGRILPVVRQRPEEEGRLPGWVSGR